MRRSDKKLPEYKELKYNFNSKTHYYEQTYVPLSFKKIPFDLKVSETQKKELIKSKYIIHGRKKNGKYLFFSGLIPTGNKNQYYGDHYEYIKGNKKKSFIIFQFSDNKRELIIYFFNHYYLYPKKRSAFIRDFMESLNKKREGNHTPSNMFKQKPTAMPLELFNKDKQNND